MATVIKDNECPVSLSLILEPKDLIEMKKTQTQTIKKRKLGSSVKKSKKPKRSTTFDYAMGWSFDQLCSYPVLPYKNNNNLENVSKTVSESETLVKNENQQQQKIQKAITNVSTPSLTTRTLVKNSENNSSTLSSSMQFCKSHIVDLMIREGRIAINILEILGTLPVDKHLYTEMKLYAYQCLNDFNVFERLVTMSYHRPATWKLCHITLAYFEFWYRHEPTIKINWKTSPDITSLRLVNLITISMKNNDFLGFRAFFKCQPLAQNYTPQIWISLFQKHCGPYTDIQILELILKNIEVHFQISKLPNEKIDACLFPYEKWFDWSIATQLQARGIDKRVLKRGLPETYYQMIYVLFKESSESTLESTPVSTEAGSESISKVSNVQVSDNNTNVVESVKK